MTFDNGDWFIGYQQLIRIQLVMANKNSLSDWDVTTFSSLHKFFQVSSTYKSLNIKNKAIFFLYTKDGFFFFFLQQKYEMVINLSSLHYLKIILLFILLFIDGSSCCITRSKAVKIYNDNTQIKKTIGSTFQVHLPDMLGIQNFLKSIGVKCLLKNFVWDWFF